MQLDQEHRERSDSLFEQLVGLQAELAAAGSNKSSLRRLKHEDMRIRTEFAKHLLIDEGVAIRYSNKGTTVTPYRLIEGVPKRTAKSEATAWMKARGIAWDGSAPSLRHEVRQALMKGDNMPQGAFGLRVNWTVRIEITDWTWVAGNDGPTLVPRKTHYR